ncbi:AMP-binding protein [Mitsuaria sp. WAJ17]|uniref:AMP-binding protein n=1 Tax=Mitsuaria sp. WAJ17 TaxID=2761452 RepID=UPI0016029E86|nr:AMP-binding protein [Mitsuaria sp. WAJ17]MBB2486778.1 AMP-binding protein [Mitsuaria sp. WAJ17]
MNFWELSPVHGERILAIDADGSEVSAARLAAGIRTYEEALARLGARTLGLMFCSNRLSDVTLYLACLRQGHVPLLLPGDMPARQVEALQALYRPQWVAGLDPANPLPIEQPKAPPVALHPSLALLLSTSGSTGSPRLVRLSREALQANAASIARYLALGPEERAILSLPMHYSYGLSVLNSHLLAGASVVLGGPGIISPDFVPLMRRHAVTSLAGVPYMYQMLHRTGFFQKALPALRTLTQAGGKLDERLARLVSEHAQAAGRRFFVMYGQTEACARISYVPPEQLAAKMGSIGVAIPDGRLRLDPDTRELVYEGPNVMLGYAETRDDLALGDVMRGVLPTGDLARRDEDGYFFLEGRIKRFIKVYGNRIGLDEVERALEALLQRPVAVSGRDDRLVAWIEAGDAALVAQASAIVRQQFGIHPSATQCRAVDALPLLASGKKNYAALMDGS